MAQGHDAHGDDDDYVQNEADDDESSKPLERGLESSGEKADEEHEDADHRE